MEECDIAFEVALGLLQDPLLEVEEVEGMGVFYLLELQPLHEEGKVVGDFLATEDPINHVATKQSHLDLVAGVRVNLHVLMN